ncbi:MAG: hypothetical protein Q4F45_06835 [Alistipes sp.]|nr:hypothetical protein [Alistipes sp.]
MKKLLTFVIALLFATNLFAQSKPLTFLGVPIIDNIDKVLQQYAEKGYKPRIKTSKTVYGEYRNMIVKINILYNRDTQMATAVVVIPTNECMCTADEVGKLFNDMLDEFNNNPNYTADPQNKKIPEGEDIVEGIWEKEKVYEAYFYQDGDRRKHVELSIHEYDGKYYVAESYCMKKPK